MEKVWLKSYPPGIPAEIDPHEFASIRDILVKSCERFASLPAFTCMDSSLTFTELDLDAQARAREAFDPDGRMNPAKVLPLGSRCGELVLDAGSLPDGTWL